MVAPARFYPTCLFRIGFGVGSDRLIAQNLGYAILLEGRYGACFISLGWLRNGNQRMPRTTIKFVHLLFSCTES